MCHTWMLSAFSTAKSFHFYNFRVERVFMQQLADPIDVHGTPTLILFSYVMKLLNATGCEELAV